MRSAGLNAHALTNLLQPLLMFQNQPAPKAVPEKKSLIIESILLARDSLAAFLVHFCCFPRGNCTSGSSFYLPYQLPHDLSQRQKTCTAHFVQFILKMSDPLHCRINIITERFTRQFRLAVFHCQNPSSYSTYNQI